MDVRQLSFTFVLLASTASAQPDADWSLYSNGEYGFTVRHPSHYLLVRPGDDPDPGVVARIWFQDAAIAKSEVGSAHPAQFAVDVFANSSKQSLNDWLAQSRATNLARFAKEPARVGGADAVRLTGSAQMAPNVFVYAAHGAFIYRFTPLGDAGERMLATVVFTR